MFVILAGGPGVELGRLRHLPPCISEGEFTRPTEATYPILAGEGSFSFAAWNIEKSVFGWECNDEDPA